MLLRPALAPGLFGRPARLDEHLLEVVPAHVAAHGALPPRPDNGRASATGAGFGSQPCGLWISGECSRKVSPSSKVRPAASSMRRNAETNRPEEGRVGKGGVGTCRFRGCP